MAKLRTVAHQLASLSKEDRKVAMQLAGDLAGGGTTRKKRKYTRRARKAKVAAAPKPAPPKRESRPRPPRGVRPLPTTMDEE